MRYEIILDSGETPNKCTIAPLAYRPDFHVIRVKGNSSLGSLSSEFLLHHEGQCITTVKMPEASDHRVAQGIASVDCVWRRLDLLLKLIVAPLPMLVRIPEGFKTAYPRKNAEDKDPDGGLATIEAIFTASVLLGNWDTSLLSEYYFGKKYVEMNRTRFLDFGINQAGDPTALPHMIVRPRNSLQRRRNRREI